MNMEKTKTKRTIEIKKRTQQIMPKKKKKIIHE